MKKLLIFILFFLISCTPSEEEVQARIDEAVQQAVFNATSTTTTSTTTTSTTSTSLPTEQCETYIDSVLLVYEGIDSIFGELYEGDDYDERLVFYASRVNSLEDYGTMVLQISSRTDKELEILYELENFRFLIEEAFYLKFKTLYIFDYIPASESKQIDETSNEARLLGNQLKIKINNYKCEN